MWGPGPQIFGHGYKPNQAALTQIDGEGHHA
jgi:hypothetical protein